MMKASKVFIDTNVLIYQTFEDFDAEKHQLVENMLQQLRTRQWRVYISSQIIREFIAIATNEKIFNTPLGSHDVVMKVSEFQAHFHVLFETEDSITILKDLIARHQIRKQAVHDTNIAAVVIANKLDYLWTFNTKDFVKFNEIQLLQDTLPT